MNTRFQEYSFAPAQKKGFYAVLLFILWPFLAMISALTNYRQVWAKNIFWAFCAFYGFTFAIGAESEGSDIVRYVAGFQAMYGVQMSIQDVINYFLQSGEIDILRLLISYVLSRFTDSQSALTLVYGTIFGYFLSRNLWYIMERLKGSIAPITVLLLICFFLVNPIWHINGFRMWTAVHVFLFGLFPWLFEGNKKWLWVSVLSIMVHFSFIIPIAILIGYAVLGNRMNIYFGFYIVTFFISELDIGVINAYVENYAPEILQERTQGYRTESAMGRLEAEDTRNWYIQWYGAGLRWSIICFLSLLIFKGRKFIKQNKGWENLFSFTLLFYGVANIMSHLPSGSRFSIIAHLLALSIIIFYVQNQSGEKWMEKIVTATTPALLFYVIVNVRIALLSMSATSILGNPVVAIFMSGEHPSLNDFLKMLI